MASTKHTPLMQQYFRIREQYPDTVLFFQVGDFYELFFEDAKTVSAFLAIALTKRGKMDGQDIPLCGVPVHAINHYLVKLVKGGFKVAICDQLTKPQPGKVVERGVTQVFTPGTLTDMQMLDDKSASYLFSFYPGREQWGVIFTEILTAQIFATTIPSDSYRMLEAELIRFFPDEIIISQEHQKGKFDTYFKQLGYIVSLVDVYKNKTDFTEYDLWLKKQFDSLVIKKLKQFPAIVDSFSFLFWYLKKNQERVLSQFKTVQFYNPEDYLILDFATQKNLEIIKNLQNGGRRNTLFSVLDKAVTSMGSRTIKKWLQRPLIQEKVIKQRQEVVATLCKNINVMQQLEELLSSVSDVERIIGRIALGRAQLFDYLALKQSLKIAPEIKILLQDNLTCLLANIIKEKIGNFINLVEFLECALNDDISLKFIIKKGFDLELDRLRVLVNNSRQEILKLEQKEISKTGINSLKIRYNNIAGYYIEVTKSNLKLVPDDYILQQTLVNRNRYITQELKDLEREIFKAQNEIDVVENNAFQKVKSAVEENLSSLRQLAQALAYTDALLGFARVAYDYNYIIPEFNNSRDIIIKDGRHPVIEQKQEDSFIPNDTLLTDDSSVWVLTGPNMGGKSTYLRQVALICIMAQSGSLVSAKLAQLPVIDRIFTRIGSGDNLAEGKSTFLVEMEEAAVICIQATKNSLVILDEVGRGTSTFDGMALAQAIVEHIVQKIEARCLFATHYHELTHLKDHFTGIQNYYMTSKRTKDGILFLYKVAKGVCQGSFGIEVAKLACLPDCIIERAKNILDNIDAIEKRKDNEIFSEPNFGGVQASVFSGKKSDENNIKSIVNLKKIINQLKNELQKKNELLQELQSVSVDNLSPRKAFDIVWKIKEKQGDL